MQQQISGENLEPKKARRLPEGWFLLTTDSIALLPKSIESLEELGIESSQNQNAEYGTLSSHLISCPAWAKVYQELEVPQTEISQIKKNIIHRRIASQFFVVVVMVGLSLGVYGMLTSAGGELLTHISCKTLLKNQYKP